MYTIKFEIHHTSFIQLLLASQTHAYIGEGLQLFCCQSCLPHACLSKLKANSFTLRFVRQTPMIFMSTPITLYSPYILHISVCTYSCLLLLLQSQQRELRAHGNHSLGGTETTHTPHTKKKRSHLLCSHPAPTSCRWTVCVCIIHANTTFLMTRFTFLEGAAKFIRSGLLIQWSFKLYYILHPLLKKRYYYLLVAKWKPVPSERPKPQPAKWQVKTLPVSQWAVVYIWHSGVDAKPQDECSWRLVWMEQLSVRGNGPGGKTTDIPS